MERVAHIGVGKFSHLSSESVSFLSSLNARAIIYINFGLHTDMLAPERALADEWEPTLTLLSGSITMNSIVVLRVGISLWTQEKPGVLCDPEQ